jgi:predicted nuclease of predicted toxin-antitoxin system
MTFFADEGLDAPLVELLRQEGFSIMYALELMPGATDEQILMEANASQSMIITKDKDFGELVFRNKQHTNGVILIRINRLDVLNNCEKVITLLKRHQQQLAGSFTVIEEDKIRIRSV